MKINTVIYSVIRLVIKYCHLSNLLYRALRSSKSNISKLTISDAQKILDTFSHKPISGSILHEHLLITPPKYDLQIIVPAYNVELYLRNCINSILNQKTKYTYCIELVYDDSTDKTADIAESYSSCQRIHVIHQKENKGVGGARNSGLEILYAKYVMFVDSDDILMPGAIESLMNAAVKYDAECIQGGSYRLINKHLIPHSKYKTVEKRSSLEGVPWGKVFRRDIWTNLQYPESCWFEDTLHGYLIYPVLTNSYVIPEIVYAYRKNQSSITHLARIKPKSVDTYWVTELFAQSYTYLQLPDNTAFHNKMLKQILLNYNRTRNLPKEIRESIFILSANIVERYCHSPASEYCDLDDALHTYDFGAYELYCHLNLTV